MVAAVVCHTIIATGSLFLLLISVVIFFFFLNIVYAPGVSLGDSFGRAICGLLNPKGLFPEDTSLTVSPRSVGTVVFSEARPVDCTSSRAAAKQSKLFVLFPRVAAGFLSRGWLSR